MWSEINLASAVVRTGLFSLEVRLSYDEDSIGLPDGRGKTVSGYTSRLIPPVGIPTLQVHRVIVYLDFEGQASNALDTLSLCKSVVIPPFSELSSSPPRAAELQDSTLEDPSQSASEPFRTPSVQHDDFVSIEDVDDRTQAGSTLPLSLPLYRSRLSDPDNFPGLLPGTIDGVPDETETKPSLFPDIAFHLTESILRHDLLGIPKKQPRTKCRKADTSITLAEICPTMFSPGYLKVIFLPIS